ncbi:MAG: NPCBM/NEW2 domain-containing protein, partial [Clostridia bacterium]|nr:NPCBM/NEW2 domain-containing protein [Clostridia bacterium]
GDDKLLYQTEVTGGNFPINVNVDLTGVKVLKVEMYDSYVGDHAYFGDCKLYSK